MLEFGHQLLQLPLFVEAYWGQVHLLDVLGIAPPLVLHLELLNNLLLLQMLLQLFLLHCLKIKLRFRLILVGLLGC